MKKADLRLVNSSKLFTLILGYVSVINTYRVKKILSDYSSIILQMTAINKNRTNQLATKAATEILEQLKQNEFENDKKKE